MHDPEQLLRTPGAVPVTRFKQRCDDLRVGLVWRVMRLTRSLFQARRAVAQVAIDQLVAGLARYIIALAQLGDAEALPQVVGDELRSLVHRRGLTPWHRAPPAGAPDRQPVTYVPRLNCYLCIWTVPTGVLTFRWSGRATSAAPRRRLFPQARRSPRRWVFVASAF